MVEEGDNLMEVEDKEVAEEGREFDAVPGDSWPLQVRLLSFVTDVLEWEWVQTSFVSYVIWNMVLFTEVLVLCYFFSARPMEIVNMIWHLSSLLFTVADNDWNC